MTILDFALICSSIEPVIMSLKNTISWSHKGIIWAIWLAAAAITLTFRESVQVEVQLVFWVFIMPFLLLGIFRYFQSKPKVS